MIISRKIVLTGVITLGVFALGSAGAAVAHTFTIEGRTGEVQNVAPVTSGANVPSSSESPSGDESADPTDSASPSPSESPSGDQSGDQSEDPTGTTTVAPAPPINLHENDSAVDNTGGSND